MLKTRTTPQARCGRCAERARLGLPLPLACESCWNLEPADCVRCLQFGYGARPANSRHIESICDTCAGLLFEKQCPECWRWFDLRDDDDAAEWYHGHDCEVQA